MKQQGPGPIYNTPWPENETSLKNTDDVLYIDGLVEDYSISNALAIEILQSSTKPWIYDSSGFQNVRCVGRLETATLAAHQGSQSCYCISLTDTVIFLKWQTFNKKQLGMKLHVYFDRFIYLDSAIFCNFYTEFFYQFPCQTNLWES